MRLLVNLGAYFQQQVEQPPSSSRGFVFVVVCDATKSATQTRPSLSLEWIAEHLESRDEIVAFVCTTKSEIVFQPWFCSGSVDCDAIYRIRCDSMRCDQVHWRAAGRRQFHLAQFVSRALHSSNNAPKSHRIVLDQIGWNAIERGRERESSVRECVM